MSLNGTTDGIPNAILAAYPIAKPPPGVESNFVNPPNAGYRLIIVGAVLLPIMCIFVTIRMLTKIRITRKATWDDLTCMIAALGTIVYYIIYTLSVVKGHQGRHEWDLSVLITIGPWFAVTIYIINWLGTVILPFSKITFFIFYMHIFRPLRWLRVCCWLGIIFTTVCFTGFWIAQMALQTPHPGESWLQMDTDPRELYSLQHLSIPITAVSFVIDVYTFILPIAGVSSLQLTPRRKAGVILIFLTGLAAIICSLIGLCYKVYLNSHTTDSTWVSVPVSIALLAEMAVGVICACMPSMSNFVSHEFPDFNFVDSIMSLRLVSLMTSRTRSESRPSKPSQKESVRSPYSAKHSFKKVGSGNSESDEYLHANPDVEMGTVSSAKVGMPQAVGHEREIYLQREWQVSQDVPLRR